jgi:hypothetical protein
MECERWRWRHCRRPRRDWNDVFRVDADLRQGAHYLIRQVAEARFAEICHVHFVDRDRDLLNAEQP